MFAMIVNEGVLLIYVDLLSSTMKVSPWGDEQVMGYTSEYTLLQSINQRYDVLFTLVSLLSLLSPYSPGNRVVFH